MILDIVNSQRSQEYQHNLSAIYIGRNQNSMNNIAWVMVGPVVNIQTFRKQVLHMSVCSSYILQNKCFNVRPKKDDKYVFNQRF